MKRFFIPLCFFKAALCCLAAFARADEPSLKQARELELTGQYEESRELFGQLAEEHPLPAALGESRCLEARGKLDDAQAVLVAAFKKHPAKAEIPAALASLALRSGDLDAAEKHSQAALKLDPNNPAARFVKATLLRHAGKLDEAEKEYVWFIRFYNREDTFDDPDVLRLIGLATGHYTRWNPRADQFGFLVNNLRREEMKVEPKYWPAHYEAGRLFLEKFNDPEAAKQFTKALAINPNAAEVHAAMAELHVENYNLDAAKKSVDQALKLNPNLVAARLAQADLELANVRVRQALELLLETQKINPTREDLLGRIAACHLILDGPTPDGKESRSGKLTAEVLQRNPRCGPFYMQMA
ncbi:MAG: tetratricopeptide repeat protein, partial [Planctomycetales bacterium]